MIGTGIEVACPHCWQTQWIAVDVAGGRRQRWITDCEVCCQPIDIELAVDEEGEVVDVRARSESEAP